MKKGSPPRQLILRSLSRASQRGYLEIGSLRLRCALGRSGVRAMKREGDGATPQGNFRLLQIYYRADRIARPRSGLPVKQLQPHAGWCDDASDRNYNRFVRQPYPASAEKMFRTDHLYDIVVVLDHNHRPRVRGAGSAIFMHVAREDYRPTEGCIALSRSDLLTVLRCMNSRSKIHLGRW